MPEPATIFKAYDIRGVYPDEIGVEIVREIATAFIDVLGRPDAVVVGRDMRASSEQLSRAFGAAVTAAGTDVVDIGLASTDELYFASGSLHLPGAIFTASHNPARYGGVKLCRAGAAPIGWDTGLSEIAERVTRQPATPPDPGPVTGSASTTASAQPRGDRPVRSPGSVRTRDLLDAYATHLHGLVDTGAVHGLTLVVDAGNGMAGRTAPAVFGAVDVKLIPLYFDLDGTFPNHEANPIEPENLRDLQAKVRTVGADLGLAFDGDADRCFVVDENGDVVSPSAITALIAVRELAREPGATILYNLITSRAVPEIITEHGGRPVRSRVGHSIIKAIMAETGAIFGGEHSAHYYFRDFWRADSGMLAALHTIAALGGDDRPLSALVAGYSRYVASGEINSTVEDQTAALTLVRRTYAGTDGVSCDELDGLTVDHRDWWFNLRPSNTEPLLRLNAEAVDRTTMERIRDEVLSLVRNP